MLKESPPPLEKGGRGDFLAVTAMKGYQLSLLAIKAQLKQASLLVVSKTRSAEEIRPVLMAGHRLFGENRVQEAMQKWPSLRQEFPDIKLHLIGHLQTNKVREAVALFDVIESLDRPSLAIALAGEMAKQKRNLPCFVQVNIGEEASKSGVSVAEASKFITDCREVWGLSLQGLMCIPPLGKDPCPYFRQLREMADANGLVDCSMGMSGDFEEAIAAGSTLIRVGTAIFGERPKNPRE